MFGAVTDLATAVESSSVIVALPLEELFFGPRLGLFRVGLSGTEGVGSRFRWPGRKRLLLRKREPWLLVVLVEEGARKAPGEDMTMNERGAEREAA